MSKDVGSLDTDTAGDEPTWYRCAACGNKTRFDVTKTTTTTAYHHYTVGGELTIEEPEILSEDIEKVECRWCGHGNAIEILERPESWHEHADSQPSPG